MAMPGLLLVTRRSPMRIGPFVASTFTRTRPEVATRTFDGDASPSEMPGFFETTPATVVSYEVFDNVTSLGCEESSMTTVPGSMAVAAGTHSAKSWYLALML